MFAEILLPRGRINFLTIRGSVKLHGSDPMLSHTQWINAKPVLFWLPPDAGGQQWALTYSGVPNLTGSGPRVIGGDSARQNGSLLFVAG